jgi:hypothetical protein
VDELSLNGPLGRLRSTPQIMFGHPPGLALCLSTVRATAQAAGPVLIMVRACPSGGYHLVFASRARFSPTPPRPVGGSSGSRLNCALSRSDGAGQGRREPANSASVPLTVASPLRLEGDCQQRFWLRRKLWETPTHLPPLTPALVRCPEGC